MRVSALFVKHTKTGNPLVDSVAEHQPGSADAYWNYLGHWAEHRHDRSGTGIFAYIDP